MFVPAFSSQFGPIFLLQCLENACTVIQNNNAVKFFRVVKDSSGIHFYWCELPTIYFRLFSNVTVKIFQKQIGTHMNMKRLNNWLESRTNIKFIPEESSAPKNNINLWMSQNLLLKIVKLDFSKEVLM